MRNLAFVLVLCGGVWACGSPSSPTGEISSITTAQSPPPITTADPIPPIPPISTAGTTDAKTLCANQKFGVSCLVLAFSEAGATVRFTNAGTATQHVVLQSYMRGDPDDFAHQVADDRYVQEADLGPGTWIERSIVHPPCKFQTDSYIGPKDNFPPHGDDVLLGYETRGTTPCDLDKPPTSPPPVVRSCYEGNAVLAEGALSEQPTYVERQPRLTFDGVGPMRLNWTDGSPVELVYSGEVHTHRYQRAPRDSGPDVMPYTATYRCAGGNIVASFTTHVRQQ